MKKTEPITELELDTAINAGLCKDWLPDDYILKARDVRVFNLRHSMAQNMNAEKSIERIAVWLNLPAACVFRSYERLGLATSESARKRWKAPRTRYPLMRDNLL